MLTTLGVGLPGTLMMITKMISVIMINVWSHDDDHHCYHAQQMSGRPTLVLIWEPGANHQQPFGSSQEHGLRERGWTKKTLLLQAGAHVEANKTIQRLFRFSFVASTWAPACSRTLMIMHIVAVVVEWRVAVRFAIVSYALCHINRNDGFAALTLMDTAH